MNKVVLLGRLTRDPDIKYTQTNNIMVASFTLAVNRRFAKEGDEKTTDFIYCTAWSKTAEFVSKYFSKGLQIGVIGRLEQHEWEDKDGKKQSKTQVVAEEVYFADAKREGQANNATNIQQTSTFIPENTSNFGMESDDDLPF